MNDRQFYHVEGWLQHCKHATANPGFAGEIARTQSASQARAMGDERLLWADLDLGKRALRVDEVEQWHEHRLRALRDGLWAMVSQNPRAKRELLGTQDARLEYVDDSPFYARPANHVGLELMRIRDALRREPPSPEPDHHHRQAPSPEPDHLRRHHHHHRRRRPPLPPGRR